VFGKEVPNVQTRAEGAHVGIAARNPNVASSRSWPCVSSPLYDAQYNRTTRTASPVLRAYAVSVPQHDFSACMITIVRALAPVVANPGLHGGGDGGEVDPSEAAALAAIPRDIQVVGAVDLEHRHRDLWLAREVLQCACYRRYGGKPARELAAQAMRHHRPVGHSYQGL